MMAVSPQKIFIFCQKIVRIVHFYKLCLLYFAEALTARFKVVINLLDEKPIKKFSSGFSDTSTTFKDYLRNKISS